MYESGMSLRSIALELMETGELKQTILNNANRLVQTVITRSEYCGIKSNHSNYNYPAIITKTQFEKCKEISKNKTREHYKVKRHCLCKRLTYCHGYMLSPNIAKEQYQLCTIDRKYNAAISIDKLDDIVWNVILEQNITGEIETNRIQLEKEANIAVRKVQQAKRNIEDLIKQINRIENRIIEGKMSEIKGDDMIRQKNIDIKEQQDIMDKNNYIYGQKIQMIVEENYKIDYSQITDNYERQQIVRKYVDRIDLEKTGIRGHYLIEIKMKNGQNYNFKYYRSGPWTKVEKI